MNSCSLLLEAQESKLKIYVLFLCLEIFPYFAFYAYIFLFVLVSTSSFTLNRLSLCGALACSMYSETATRDIFRFHLPSSGHILVLVPQHTSSWQLHPEALPLLFLQISSLLLKFFSLLSLST